MDQEEKLDRAGHKVIEAVGHLTANEAIMVLAGSLGALALATDNPSRSLYAGITVASGVVDGSLLKN